MKKRFISIISLSLVMVLLITACGGKDTKNSGSTSGEKIIRVNNSSEPGSLDPALATGTHESWVLQHSFEGLMKYDQEGNIVPGMASDHPTVSEDGLTYTFKLKEGLKWSNGDPLTAKDFEFSWKRLADPETASDYAFQMEYLKNGSEVVSGELDKEELGVKAVDDLTLEVQLNYIAPFFESLAAFYSLYPVNEKVVTENPKWAENGESYVSNGAFTLTNWEHDSKIQIVKNENYYDADNVKIDGIDFDIIDDKNTEWAKYDSGELDLVVAPQNDVVSKMIEEKNKELVMGDRLSVEFYFFNLQEKPFNNVKVRQGLSMAVDRNIITNNVRQMGDTVAEGIVPFGFIDENGVDFRKSNGNLIKEGATEAKKLFEEGLKEEGMTLEDFNEKRFVLVYNTNDTHKKVTQAIQEMWNKNLGAEIQIENTDFQVMIDRGKKGDFNLARYGWIGDFRDPMTMIDLWETDSPNNWGKYSNPEFDKLIKSGKEGTDVAQRMEDMKAAEQILLEDAVVMPLYFNKLQYAVKPNITGVYNVSTEYPSFIYADIE